MDDQRRDERCDDAVTLQKLLDGELDPVAAEVVLYHTQWCERCGPALGRLREARNRATDLLGLEDQADQQWADDALRRSKKAVTAAKRAAAVDRGPWTSRWRLVGVAVMAVLLLFVAPPFFRSDAGASSERIARESILRERLWIARPNSVRHWIVESDIRNRPGVRDGRYRREVWQQNGTDGSWARITRQYDDEGRLVYAHWMREDGSSTSWVSARPDEVVTRPATAALAEEAAGLSPELQRAVHAHLALRRQSSTLQVQQQNFADYLQRVSAIGNRHTTFERIRSDSGSDFYRIRSEVLFSGAERPVVRLQQEEYIGALDYRRYRVRTWRHFATGVVETEDARTTYVERASAEEFRRQGLDDLIARVKHVVALTASDIAAEQLAREKFSPPTPVVPTGGEK